MKKHSQQLTHPFSSKREHQDIGVFSRSVYTPNRRSSHTGSPAAHPTHWRHQLPKRLTCTSFSAGRVRGKTAQPKVRATDYADPSQTMQYYYVIVNFGPERLTRQYRYNHYLHMHELRSNPLGKDELVPRSYLILSLWTAKQIGLHKRRHGSPDFFPSPRLASPHPSRQQVESLDTSVSDSITSNSDSITARQVAVNCPLYDVSGIATSRSKLPCMSETPLCSVSHTGSAGTCCTACP